MNHLRKNQVSMKDIGQPDEGLCCVCYRKVEIYSIGECNHPVCFNCCTRMRILSSSTKCAICRKVMDSVIFTRTLQPYINMNQRNMTLDRKFNIYFESESVMKLYDELLEHVCKECDKLNKFSKFCHLEKHMIEDHGKYYCHLCVNNLDSFTHERKYYSMNMLKIHRSQGDADDKSHKGHPLCEYCNERFMDKDALFIHLRKDHEYCHYCDADGFQRFYGNYSQLRSHFIKDHFLCEEGDCGHECFTAVFRTKLDLKAHWSQRHAHTVSKQEARQLRTIDMEFPIYWGMNNEQGRGGRPNGSNRMGTRSEQDLDDQEFAAAALPPSVTQQKPVNIKCAQDFPSLGGATASVADESRNNNHSKSMSQRLAEQNRFSVRRGNKNLTNEDFPLLKPSVSLNTNLPTSSVQLSVNRKNTPNSVPSNVSIQYKARGQANHNKNPQISSITHSSNITLGQSGARPKTSLEEFPSLNSSCQYEKPTWVRASKSVTNGNLPKKEVRVGKVKPARPDFSALNDFPSLGGPSGDLQRVLSYAGKSTVSVPMKKASLPPHATRATEDIKNKNPQPKSKAIAGRPKKKLNLSNIFSDFNEPEEDLSMTRLGDYQSIAAKSGPNVSIVRQEDLVRSELKIGELTTPKFKKGDFPSLGSGSIVHQVNSNWGVPPNNLSKRNTKLNSTINKTAHLSISNSEPHPSTYSFMLPPNFDDRNKCLISTISRHCQNDVMKFNKFKSVAALLCNNELSYKSYYSQCKQIMGKANFMAVFPELIALLPDIKIQQGILEEFRKTDGTKGFPVHFDICSTCQQVLLPEDFKAHSQNHIL